ncbi:MAG: hypothetical protein GY751_06365 [Bacteroidetes bacterium]|nr:hypothetical protein [Bacteroidota bacterium]
MLGHNTFDFSLSPTLRTFNAHGGPHPPKPRKRKIVKALPATTTTTQYIFANPSDETDDTLNPMFISVMVGLAVVVAAGAYMIGKSR